jgi:hypothetical protein
MAQKYFEGVADDLCFFEFGILVDYFAGVADYLCVFEFGILVDYSAVRNQRRMKLTSRCAQRKVAFCSFDFVMVEVCCVAILAIRIRT